MVVVCKCYTSGFGGCEGVVPSDATGRFEEDAAELRLYRCLVYCLVDLPLQFRQQIERFERSQAVQVDLA